MGTLRTTGWTLALAAALCACSETPPPTGPEDEPRAMVPVPACIAPLRPRAHANGTLRNLHDDEVWQLVFPSYDAKHQLLPATALSCTGTSIFDDPVFKGATTRGTPIQVQDGDILYGTGGEHMRIAWLRTHRWSDGSEAGPIALVRARDDFAEVYAIGVFKRSAAQSTFQAERVGDEFLISGSDDGCLGVPRTNPCETQVTLLLPRFGRLVPVATIDMEKRAYATGGERGVSGPVEYRLTTSPQYTAGGVKLFEQVQATDSSGHVVRTTELERTLVLRDGRMQASSQTIWDKVFPEPKLVQ